MQAFVGPIYEAIEAKITEEFHPSHLEIINESHKHSVPPNSETHFKLVIVSEAFEAKRLLQRHRMVNHVLQEELEGGREGGGIHALALVTRTQEEWAENQEVNPSPNCRGGGRK